MNSDFSQHVAGVIAEYNPFHNGHAFHIREAKKRCGASYCIAVMSGDFVQRGGPAIFDKYARTRMALSAGADLVVEMPPIFALASAEDFAACGIALLHHLGVVTHVCFGSECGDTDPLMELARILTGEPELRVLPTQKRVRRPCHSILPPQGKMPARRPSCPPPTTPWGLSTARLF